MNKRDVPWINLIWEAHYRNNKLPQACSPCGSFWWKDILALWESFSDLFTCKPRDGSSIRFWKDKRREVAPEHEFPQLFSFVKNQNVSLKQMMPLSMDDLP